MTALMFILTLALFLGIDALVQKRHALKERKHMVLPLSSKLLKAPKGLFYTPGHTWYKMNHDGSVTIGLSELVHKMVGEIDAVETPADEAELQTGDTLITLIQGENRISIKSPLAGRITMLNPALAWAPDHYLAESYSDGWICKMEPVTDTLPVKVAMIGQGALDWMKDEIRRFTEVIHGQMSAKAGLAHSMLDGGQLPEGVMTELDGDIWQAVEKEMFDR